MKKGKKIIAAVVLALLAVLGIGGFVYVSDYYHADDDALKALNLQGDGLQVEQDGAVIWFIPENPAAGIIFYPGGKVEYTAYAPLLRALAEEGILSALVKMPCNLAVLDADAASGLKYKHPEVTSWYMAGHSLGGAMAANHAAKHADWYDGVILLASYSTKDLNDTGLRVLSVYGSEDGVMNRESYEKYRNNLPADSTEVVLPGGNHAQFDSYGPQEGDGRPTISKEEQIRGTTEAVMEWL